MSVIKDTGSAFGAWTLLQYMALMGLLVLFFSLSAQAGTAKKEQVLFYPGGTNDDMVGLLLLKAMPDVQVKGVVVTNADTIAGFAMQAHWKIAQACGGEMVPIGLSKARGWNPFPYTYRQDTIFFHSIPALAMEPANPDWPPYPQGNDLAERVLRQALEEKTQVTVLVTAPITALKQALQADPELTKAIARIVFMAGALDVPGNLDPQTIPKQIANPKAEWNIFWDPMAVDWIFTNTQTEIILLPLDVTNDARVSQGFRSKLKKQQSQYISSRIAFQGYKPTLDEPYFRLWNSAAACYIGEPGYFAQPQTVRLRVRTQGFMQGALQRDVSGREVKVVFDFADRIGFYDYFIRLLRY